MCRRCQFRKRKQALDFGVVVRYDRHHNQQASVVEWYTRLSQKQIPNRVEGSNPSTGITQSFSTRNLLGYVPQDDAFEIFQADLQEWLQS